MELIIISLLVIILLPDMATDYLIVISFVLTILSLHLADTLIE